MNIQIFLLNDWTKWEQNHSSYCVCSRFTDPHWHGRGYGADTRLKSKSRLWICSITYKLYRFKANPLCYLEIFFFYSKTFSFLYILILKNLKPFGEHLYALHLDSSDYSHLATFACLFPRDSRELTLFAGSMRACMCRLACPHVLSCGRGERVEAPGLGPVTSSLRPYSAMFQYGISRVQEFCIWT